MKTDPRRDGCSTMSNELELTDYRRTVSELYAAVRAEDDPKQAYELWRRGRDELFRSHPQSPLPPGDPLRATGLPYWPYDPGLRSSCRCSRPRRSCRCRCRPATE